MSKTTEELAEDLVRTMDVESLRAHLKLMLCGRLSPIHAQLPPQLTMTHKAYVPGRSNAYSDVLAVVSILPETFNTREAMNAGKTAGISNSRIKNGLKKFVDTGDLVEISKGSGTCPTMYQKIAK